MTNLKEKMISKNYIYKGNIVNLREDKAELPDQSITDRIVVEHPGGVGIALEDEDGKFFFVSQWRYAQSEVTLEYPAGKRETGEDDLNTAKREIVEEVGYEGKDWKYLGLMYPTPAYDSETIGMYYAKKGAYKGQHLDVDENINVSKYTLNEITEMILNGKIHDAKTIGMTFLVKEMKEKGMI